LSIEGVWFREVYQILTEKSSVHVPGLPGIPGLNFHIVNKWLNSFPSVHSD